MNTGLKWLHHVAVDGAMKERSVCMGANMRKDRRIIVDDALFLIDENCEKCEDCSTSQVQCV